MQNKRCGSRGFTLIASLLLLILLSGFAIGLLMMVNTEQRSGGNDLNNNYTYHAAEGAIEKMTSDLGGAFKAIQSPTVTDICNLSNNYPTWDRTVTYVKYNVSPQAGCSQPLTTQYGQIQSGSDAGLSALIIPVTMNVEVQRLTGATVSMTRTAQVALIPVFQFGIFSDSDLFFGRSPNLGFAGRVHTNGDLYLGVADADTLVFGDKISAYGNVIRAVMDNNVSATGNDDNGPVLIPTTYNGCLTQLQNISTGTTPTASNTCKAIGATDGSVVGGHGSAQNTSTWQNVSLGTYGGYLIDGNVQANGQPGPNNTGASNLTLPFVAGTTQPYEIIRRPPSGESITSLLGSSRLANQAQIRVLLSDKENDLHLSDWNSDLSGDVELSSLAPEFSGTAFSQNGITINSHTYYLGESACGASTIGNPCTSGDTSFVEPPSVEGGATANAYASKPEWPLINGWLRVEAKWASDGVWHPVTQEWLTLGFARGLAVPTAPATNTLAVVGGQPTWI